MDRPAGSEPRGLMIMIIDDDNYVDTPEGNAYAYISIGDRTNDTNHKSCLSHLQTAHRYKISSMHLGQDSG